VRAGQLIRRGDEGLLHTGLVPAPASRLCDCGEWFDLVVIYRWGDAQGGKSKELAPLWAEGLPTTCPTCRAEAEAQEAGARREERIAEAQRSRRVREAEEFPRILTAAGYNLNDPVCNASFENFDRSRNPEAFEAALAFVNKACSRTRGEPMRWLYLEGFTGTGKSHLIVAMRRELWRRAYPGTVILDVAPALIDKVQRGYSDGSADQIRQSRINADVWLLDEVAKGPQTPDKVGVIVSITDMRVMIPTSLGSNYAAAALEERHMDFLTLADRLRDEYARVVVMGGVSGRGKHVRPS
jgi:DNA replication protein DnaC